MDEPKGAAGGTVDARLLRFRSRPGTEAAAPLAEELLAAGRTREALEVVQAGLQKTPEDGRLLIVEGQAWLSEGQLERAQAALIAAARVAPRNKEAFRTLGEVLLKRGDPSRAAKVLERATQIDPNDRAVKMLAERAARLAKIGDTEGADAAARASQKAMGGQGGGDEATVVRGEVSAKLSSDPSASDFEEEEDLPTQVGAKDTFGPGVPGKVPPIQQVAPQSRAATSPGRPMPSSPGRPMPAPPRPVTAPGKPSPWEGDAKPAGPPSPMSPPSAVVSAAKPPDRAPLPARKATLVAQGAVPAAAPVPRPPPMARPAPPPPAPPPPVAFAPPPDPFRAEPAPEPEPFAVEADVAPANVWDDAALAPLEPAFDDGEPPPPAPDADGGDLVGTEEDVDEILQMLEAEGIFEPPTGTPAAWATSKESKRDGVRVWPILLAVWILALGGAGGGWYGWQKWVEGRHAQAAHLITQARTEALNGDHSALVDSERHLVEARDLSPHDVRIPALMLFVQAQRALEEGSFDAGFLRPTVERAKRDHADQAYIEVAQAVLDASDNESVKARADLASALHRKPNDGMLLYLAGRLEQRLGDEGAMEHLVQATQREPALGPAAVALAEVKNDDGIRDEALTLLDGVLGRYHDHLRARLWRMLLGSDEVDPDQGLHDIDGMSERLLRGAPTDRLLAELVRARLFRRKGDTVHAGEAVDHAMTAGATEPRLLALAAGEARGAGKLDRAQQAAMQAVQGAPTNTDFKKMLAEIQITRRDGVHALASLGELSTDDPDVLMLSARAALLVGSDQALTAAGTQIDAFVTEHPDSTEAKALRIRLRVALGDDTQLADARTLAHDSPGDPLVTIALGEAALAAHDVRTALTALQGLVQASPDDADAHYLLGRARRADGDATGAEESFRRAITLVPSHTEAALSLGRLLLDEGKYADADHVYQDLSRRGGISGGNTAALFGRLGRVDALVGLHRLPDAQVQLEGVRSVDRDTPSYRLAAAHLHLAQARAGDAIADLRPIISAEGDKPPEILALYGDALLAAGQADPASEQYDAALAIDASLPEALLGKANVAVRAESADDAMSWAGKLADALRNRVRPPSMRARMLVALGRAKLLDRDADAAKTALTEATTLDGCPPDAWFFLGEAIGDGDAAAAHAAYQHYVDSAPDGEFISRARRALR